MHRVCVGRQIWVGKCWEAGVFYSNREVECVCYIGIECVNTRTAVCAHRSSLCGRRETTEARAPTFNILHGKINLNNKYNFSFCAFCAFIFKRHMRKRVVIWGRNSYDQPALKLQVWLKSFYWMTTKFLS